MALKHYYIQIFWLWMAWAHPRFKLFNFHKLVKINNEVTVALSKWKLICFEYNIIFRNFMEIFEKWEMIYM